MACWVTLIFLVLVSLTGLHAYTYVRSPMIDVFAQHPIVFGKPNVLNCIVGNFHPPLVEIQLLKNGKRMDNLVKQHMVFEEDWMLFIQAYTEFTPTEKDTFACRVRHPALKKPKIVEWDRLI
ncbi:beta-2-microglobulin-like [Arvicanthis niloticus]|uniref:beta-2-microglobulin-like n=1 Tax=Arvicanthis niloticus TaxID=61156 RepID=UPI00402BF412